MRNYGVGVGDGASGVGVMETVSTIGSVTTGSVVVSTRAKGVRVGVTSVVETPRTGVVTVELDGAVDSAGAGVGVSVVDTATTVSVDTTAPGSPTPGWTRSSDALTATPIA